MKKNILVALLIALLINIQSFGAVSFIMKNYSAEIGTQITIPVKVKDFVNIMSIQGTIQWDQTKLTYSSVQDFGLAGMAGSSFGVAQVSNGKLTFSWIEGSLSGINMPDSTVIFSIKFNVTGSADQVSQLAFVNAPTPFEILDGSSNTVTYLWVNGSVNIYTTVGISENPKDGFQLFQNEPNPFSGNTRIPFSVPADGIATLEVFDVLGNKVYSFNEECLKGNHSFEWCNNTPDAKPGTGIYYFRLTCGNYSAVRKMIVVR